MLRTANTKLLVSFRVYLGSIKVYRTTDKTYLVPQLHFGDLYPRLLEIMINWNKKYINRKSFKCTYIFCHLHLCYYVNFISNWPLNKINFGHNNYWTWYSYFTIYVWITIVQSITLYITEYPIVISFWKGSGYIHFSEHLLLLYKVKSHIYPKIQLQSN